MTITGIMSDWLENTIIQYALRGGSSPSIETLSGSGPWLALYSTSPWESGSGIELNGNNYKRISIVNMFTELISPTQNSTETTYHNSGSFIFSNAGGTWTEITHVGITTASETFSGSQLMFYGKLESPVNISLNDQFQIPRYSFKITLGNTYGFYLSRAILDSALNNDNVNLGTDRYLAAYTISAGVPYEPTDLQYARVVVSGSSEWQDWTSGSTSNVLEKTFPRASEDWGDIKAIGILDSAGTGGISIAGTGNLLFYSLISASRTIYEGDKLIFPIGSIQIGADNGILPE